MSKTKIHFGDLRTYISLCGKNILKTKKELIGLHDEVNCKKCFTELEKLVKQSQENFG